LIFLDASSPPDGFEMERIELNRLANVDPEGEEERGVL